ncbi:methyltransferase domain-containing protein [Nocardia sp. NPDC059240]|uniref:methyltransferase domain-containing protein n=1 Tax=Nocardia sp. NPDC059240 TaxID=3346786 RepID=UPI0036BE9695
MDENVRSSFASVDQTAAPWMLVDLLERTAILPEVVAAKGASFAALGTELVGVVADVGCGLGRDLEEMARVTSAIAVGVDASQHMLDEARRFTTGGRFVCAHAHRLPFRTGALAGARCERLLIHDQQPQASVTEMARCVAAGARVVLVEPDFQATRTTLSGAIEVTALLTDWLRRRFAQPQCGRLLPRWLSSAGLRLDYTRTFAQPCDERLTEEILGLRECALWASNVGDGDEGWRREQARRLLAMTSDRGPRSILPIVVVAASKPPSADEPRIPPSEAACVVETPS